MLFSVDTILAILGVILTIVFGYVGIKYTFRDRKKTELSFIRITSLSLFRDIIKSLDDIEIRFQGNKVGENLILLKGAFFNSGNVDIDESLVHKPLEIELSDDYQWIDFKIFKSSDGLEVKYIFEANRIVFQWDLFKEGEYFIFNSLVERKLITTEPSNNEKRITLSQSLKINQRITNLKEVKKENNVPRTMPTFLITFLLCTSFILFLGGASTYLQSYLFPKYIIYSELKVAGNKKFASFTPKNDQIIVTSEQGEEIEILKKELLPQFLTGRIDIQREGINIYDKAGALCAIILGLFVSIICISSYVSSKKKSSKFKSIQEELNDSTIANDRFTEFLRILMFQILN
jgi:hypothetical protein